MRMSRRGTIEGNVHLFIPLRNYLIRRIDIVSRERKPSCLCELFQEALVWPSEQSILLGSARRLNFIAFLSYITCSNSLLTIHLLPLPPLRYKLCSPVIPASRS